MRWPNTGRHNRWKECGIRQWPEQFILSDKQINFKKMSLSVIHEKFFLLIMLGLCVGRNSAHAENWMLSTAPSFHWKAVASSADGIKLAA
ncbi:MAG: hypothetical protein ACR2H1_05490, partial [Limisphaerales bacterium]